MSGFSRWPWFWIAQLERARKGIAQQKVRESEQRAAVEATRHRLKAAQWALARQQELLNVATSYKEVVAAKE
jgi:hypothetical protein